MTDLLDYTEWERETWRTWFGRHGVQALCVSVGPHGDGRFHVVGDVVRHILSAEKRYVERLSRRPLTDTASIPADDVDALFQLGRQSRNDLRAFIDTFPPPSWDASQDLTLATAA